MVATSLASQLPPGAAIVRVHTSVAVVQAFGCERVWAIRKGVIIGREFATRMRGERQAALSPAFQQREAQLWERVVATQDARRQQPWPEPGQTPSPAWLATVRTAQRTKKQYEQLDNQFLRNGSVRQTVRRAVIAAWEATVDRACGICGRPIADAEPRELDHRCPPRYGGSHEAENLRVVHRRCNSRRLDMYWQPGMRVRPVRFVPRGGCGISTCLLCPAKTEEDLHVGTFAVLVLCPAHRDWPTVRQLLAAYGVPEQTLTTIAWPPVPATDGRKHPP